MSMRQILGKIGLWFAVFVVVSQLKINVTNAYAGSLAWSNFFSRVTHSHPGRVVWVVFNTLIAFMLMEMNVFQALPHFIDDWGWIVLLLLGRKALTLIEDDLPLVRTLPFLRFRDRRDELCPSPAFDKSLSRLALLVQLPVSERTLIRRI